MKLLRNENGSSLLMIIITIGVLTVLGTAILSMTIVNVNMKYTDRDMKKALYYSESGIDQVTAMIGEYVDEAISDANEKAIADVNRTYKLTQEIVEYLNVYYPEHYLDSLSNIQGEVSRYNLKTGLSVDAAEFIDKRIYLSPKFLETMTSSNYPELVSDNYPELKIYFEHNSEKSLESLFYNESSYTTADGYVAFLEHDKTIETYGIKIIPAKNKKDDEDNKDNKDNKLSKYSKGRLDYYFVNYMNGKAKEIEKEIKKFEVKVSDGTKTTEYDFPGTEVTIDNSDIKMYVYSITEFVLNDEKSNMVINDLECEFTYKDHTRKKIKTDIVINRLSDNISVVMEQKLKEVTDNPIWQYPIITMEDLNLNGSNTIKGSTYAYGAETTSSTKTNHGGIIVKNGTSTIFGDVITHAYLQTRGSGTININGSVYADSVVIQEGAKNSEIIVNEGNVYTCDDIELDDVGTVTIDGSYFGYSNTSVNEEGNAAKPNGASSIILNRPEGSKIEIKGNSIADSNPYIYKDSINNKEYIGVFIGGTAWIEDEFSPIPQGTSSAYQTGESVGIRGNYLAYAYPCEPFSTDGADLTVGKKSGLSLYYRYSAGKQYDKNDKIEYFKKMSELNPELINKGNGSININKSTYDDGAMAGIGFTDTNEIYHPIESKEGKLADIAKIISRDHLFLLSFLKHFGKGVEGHKTLFNSSENPANIVQRIQSGKDADTYNTYNPLNVYTNVYNEGNINTELLTDIDDKEKVEVEIRDGTIINCTEVVKLKNEDVTINKEGNYSGIIFATKDVTLGTGVNFYGTIIAGGSVTLNGTATITNNTKEIKKYLALLIANNSDLQAIFNVSNTTDTLGDELPKLQYFQSSSIVTGNETRMNYSNLIKFRRWRVDG